MQNRIKALRKSLGLNQTEFGRRLGVTTSAISGYELGTVVPSAAIILSICREFHVSETWLRTGAGDMRADATREEELGRLLGELITDPPESFRTALITTLLRFPADGPEWEVLERIYDSLARELPERKSPGDTEDRKP